MGAWRESKESMVTSASKNSESCNSGPKNQILEPLPLYVMIRNIIILLNFEELISSEVPEMLKNNSFVISCHDANLCHIIVTVRSVSGVLHFVRKTPVE